MRLTLYVISIILFMLSIFFGIYEEKIGQIKMRDNEIPCSEVNFQRRNIL